MSHVDDPQTQKANLGFIRASMREPLLTRDREFDLARRWREGGDEPALHELVRSYTRLVVSMAGRFRSYGLPAGDLVQEGNVGLMQAASRFEPERDVRFSTYASWWIRSAMQDYILRNWSIVRTGTTAAQKSLFFNLRRLRARISAETAGQELGDAGRRRIAAELQVPLSDVESMEQRLSATDHSLNALVGDDGDSQWQDFLTAADPSPEQNAIASLDGHQRTHWLHQAMAELNERERHIIRERRLREEGVTLEELGRALGVSKERVRQLEHRAMDKLRVLISAHIERPVDLLPEGEA
ncbi:RNA polymerase factor sigma-32 [Radicibacter daui]|uniref:RNA polymerase factor sigma-32 n=1 Tax=Radicibacter daui TaxID=3064829 RepID=UPI004046D091